MAGRDRDRRAGLRRAAGRGDARLDIERIKASGLLERVKVVIAEALKEGGIGIEQSIEPTDQDAARQQIEQGTVSPGLAACRGLWMSRSLSWATIKSSRNWSRK